MTKEPETFSKDRWDKFAIFSKTMIPWVGLAFTVVFGVMEYRIQKATLRLTASNLKLSKSQIKVSLMPLLSSKDANRRLVALEYAKLQDEQFAAEVATILALKDPDKEVREGARSDLGILSLSPQKDVKQLAKKGIKKYGIMNELRSKGLIEKLKDAEGYIDGGAPNGDEEAMKIYREVIGQLSSNSLNKFDQELFAAARKDDKEGRLDQAVRKYRSLFADFH